MYKANAPCTDSFSALYFKANFFSLYKSLTQHQTFSLFFSSALLFLKLLLAERGESPGEGQRQGGLQKQAAESQAAVLLQGRAVTHFLKCIWHFIARKHVVPHKWLKHYRATALPGGHVFMVCSMLLHCRLEGRWITNLLLNVVSGSLWMSSLA